MRRPATWLLAGALAITPVLAGACGDDDDGSAPTTTGAPATGGEEETDVPTAEPSEPARDVALTASVRLDRSRVLFDYTLANTGADDVAVVDPATVVDTLTSVEGGGYRAAYLRTSGDATAAAPLPMLRGFVVAAGGEITGTTGITGQFDELPPAVELCIEVVPRPWTDAGDGVAEMPYRPTDTEPVLACSGQLAVPDGD